ncbi:hypothetical protein CK934_25860 [Chitinophaga sp. MD30]|nr:hypothetical protein CK934_25860 [Chitinophaga sp. MD30]
MIILTTGVFLINVANKKASDRPGISNFIEGFANSAHVFRAGNYLAITCRHQNHNYKIHRHMVVVRGLLVRINRTDICFLLWQCHHL